MCFADLLYGPQMVISFFFVPSQSILVNDGLRLLDVSPVILIPILNQVCKQISILGEIHLTTNNQKIWLARQVLTGCCSLTRSICVWWNGPLFTRPVA